MEILLFAIGMVFFYTKSYYALIPAGILYLFHPRWTLLAAFLAACFIAAWHQYWVSDTHMPALETLSHAQLSGVIASIPNQTPDRIKFEFKAYQLNEQPIQARILLSCYQDCPPLRLGQSWGLNAKIHRIHNLNNPGGRDYKTLLAAQHIHWTGYALGASFKQQSVPIQAPIVLSIREQLAQSVTHLVHDELILGIFQALTLGITTHISQDSWALFRRTGTTHLMVISGAHIALVAGMLFRMICYLWSHFPRLCLRYPAQKIACLVAIIAGFSYALLAGFGVPAERSAVASIFMFARHLGQKKFGAWQAWRYALLIVLLSEPHAVLMPGFYLSFMAVAILLAMNQRIHVTGIRKVVLMQLSCMLGLLPLTLFWFSYGSIDGFFANLVAIPLVSFIIVPLSLVCLLFGQYCAYLISALTLAITTLIGYLHWIDTLTHLNITKGYLSIILPCLATVSTLIAVFLPINSLRLTALTMLILSLYPARSVIKTGEFQVAILDVGQGSAAIIRTHQHLIVYDAGGQIYHGPEMGSLVVIPYLDTLGITSIDRIIISHPDLDHRGGLPALEAHYPVRSLIVDDPNFYHHGQSCHDYPAWTWDGVDFRFFAIPHIKNDKNNRSCVLQVSNRAGQVLFTGDIEREAEHYLVERYHQALQSSVLIVPHHGSKTSSTPAFLKIVAPQYAVLSYGFDNRYHFPHTQTLWNYQKQHVQLYNTSEQGMISLYFSRKALKITTYVL